jgi:hypothetical protein
MMDLPHTVQVQRRAATADVDELNRPALGAYELVETALAFVQPRAAREVQALADGGPEVADWWAMVAPTVDVRPEDRLVWGTRTFEVRGVLPFSDLLAVHHLEIALRAVP